MTKTFIAPATSLGIAFGSLGMAGAPAFAAMSAPMAGKSDVQLVKHYRHHAPRRWACRVHWVKKKIWRHHHQVWITVPVRRCGWFWWGSPYPWWW